VSEVPDEIARGAWLKTVAAAGLELSLMTARFLARNGGTVRRIAEVDGQTVTLQISRKYDDDL
jgi:hypothetical protein